MTHQDPRLSIAHVDAERGFSGGEVQVFLLMEGLRARGHRNLLFCSPGSRSEAEAQKRGFEVHSQKMRGDLDLGAVLGLRKGLRSAKVDLVHLHTGRATWLGGLAAASLGLPALTTRRQDRLVKRNWRTRLIYNCLTQRGVAISRAVAQCLTEGGVDPARLRVIPSSVQGAQLQSQTPREELRRSAGLGSDDFVLLVMAALVRRKGLDVLLQALAQLASDGDDKTQLWIAGDGDERAALEQEAQRLGLKERVRFLGQRQDKAELLASCDVFLMPSRREGLGVAALEAMAAGRAVIASAVGGLADAVLHEETGLLVPPDDTLALSQAIQRLRQDPELLQRLAAAGPARVARGHLPEQMVQAYEELYFEMLKGETK